ncbi:hypothetical protein SNEBB_008277 [Seison nebaliae]|nr:hypothetical protein SNEBB_008277 [Seison nebaliae]
MGNDASKKGAQSGTYDGFDNDNPALNVGNLVTDDNFQRAALKTSANRKPPIINKRLKTGFQKTSLVGAPQIGSNLPPGTGFRPTTSTNAAGFSESIQTKSSSEAPPLYPSKKTPEEVLHDLEVQAMEIAEKSCILSQKNRHQEALDKAKQASKKEKLIQKKREELKFSDTNNELSRFININLANQYCNSEMYDEGISVYRKFTAPEDQNFRPLHLINEGNIYFQKKDFQKATKCFNKAVNFMGADEKLSRTKIQYNIAVCFIRMKRFNDAINRLEALLKDCAILKELCSSTLFSAAFNLLLCYHLMDDKTKMESAFRDMIQIAPFDTDVIQNEALEDDAQIKSVFEVVQNDPLTKYENGNRRTAEKKIMIAIELVSQTIRDTYEDGYQWCVETIKLSPYEKIVHDLEIKKMIRYLRYNAFDEAVGTLKSYEKKETSVANVAANNLAFLYFQEGKYKVAHKFCDGILKKDKFNSITLTNKGACYFAEDQNDEAERYFVEAIKNDSQCMEALYNMALLMKQKGNYSYALKYLNKIQKMQDRVDAQVLTLTGTCHALLHEYNEAINFYNQALSLHPHDSSILVKLGEMHQKLGDLRGAYQHYLDAYKIDSSNMRIIEWLGDYHIQQNQFFEAIKYFYNASMAMPTQEEWPLKIASCLVKKDIRQAIVQYKRIHVQFPENIECLTALVKLLNPIDHNEAQMYATFLKKAERAQYLRGKDQTAPRNISGKQKVVKPKEEESQPHKDPILDVGENDVFSRPKTAARNKMGNAFENDDIDDMLPD